MPKIPFEAAYVRYSKTPPAQLGPDQLRQYHPHLIQERKLATPTAVAQIAALRFFYVKTLGRLSPQFRIPSPKLPKRMPAVLSREEVWQLIAAAFPSLHRYHASFQQRKMIRAIGVTMATVQNPTPRSAGPGAIRQCPV